MPYLMLSAFHIFPSLYLSTKTHHHYSLHHLKSIFFSINTSCERVFSTSNSSFPSFFNAIQSYIHLPFDFMASLGALDQISTNQIEIPVYNNANQTEQKQCQGEDDNDQFDYSHRAQWLRAALLGANDGLVSVSSLMMGVGAVKEDVKAMLLAGFAGLVAGACSMAIGEFVSVYTQYDIERAQMERDMKNRNGNTEESDGEDESEKEKLPNPTHAAMASATAFIVGALVPLLAAAFINEHKVRLGVVAAVASFALVMFGGVGAVLGRTPVVRSCGRVLVGGWLAMAITFGLTKLIGTKGMEV